MRLEQLQYLIEISKCHSLTLAAENLFITQPALSRSIIALEEELGVELLARTSSGVSLTSEAKALLPIMHKILFQSGILHQAAQSLHKEKPIFEEASFSIATSPAIIDTYLPLILRMFKEEYPLMDIDINLRRTQELLRMTQENTEQLLLVTETVDFESKSPLTRNLLLTEDYSAVVRCDSDLAKKRFIHLKDALKNKLIFGNNGIDLPQFFMKEVRDNPELDILLMSNNIEIVKEMILTYDALFISNNTLISNSNFTSEFKIIPLKSKNTPAKTNLFAYYNPNHLKMAGIQPFLEKFTVY